MHHANHFYGHADIMARYVGLAEAPTIWGYLQHGWNLHDGFAVGTAFAPGYKKFVWSDTVARRGWALGLRDYVVVGAPFSYLLALSQDPPDADRQGTIVYPFHGWEGQNVRGSHSAYAREVRAVEGDVPLTACLYWHEYEDPEVRAAYADNGFRVITHGRRGHMHRGTDTQFLDNQLTELRRHRRVVSNRLGSALLYGAATGASIGVYGDPMVLENDHAVLGGMAKQLRLYPELHQPFVPDDVATAVADAELRLSRLLPPAEIVHLFGWESDLSA
jgi:hypothetical protein